MRPLSADDPREIGPYRLSALLGAGGMGRVYLGTGPGGDVAAVKAVRAEFAYDPGFRGRFARELELSGRVRGDFTPRVLAADPAGTPPWMATEYVAGPTLHDLVRETGPLPEEAVRFLARGTAAALERVHGLGTVHRDLKPGNVMVSASGPQVIDFGVARALEEDADEETLVAGTPGYMAPEQVDGGGATAATDVFALGGVLVYALTGTGPFGDGHPAAVVFRISHQEPVLDGVPEGLRGLVAACLAKDPADRPSAARVLEELGGPVAPAARAGEWLPAAAADLVEGVAEQTAELTRPDDTAVEAPTGTAGAAAMHGADDTTVAHRTGEAAGAYRAAGAAAAHGTGGAPAAHGAGGWRVSRGRRALAVGAGAAALVLVAGLGAWASLGAGGGLGSAQEEGGDPGSQAQGSAGSGSGGPGPAPGCSLPGDLAPEYVEAARSEPQVPGADTHDLDVHSYPVPVFVQGGDVLALSHPEGIALWDTETGEELAYVGADLPDFAALPVVSPDGCRFGYPSESGGVHVFDLRTGEHTVYAEEARLPVGLLAFSPDGTDLAVAEGSVGDGAHVIDLATGDITTVFEGGTQGIAYAPDGGRLAVTGPERSVVVDTVTGAEVFKGPEAAAASTRDSLALPTDDLFLYLHEEGIVLADPASGEDPLVLAPPDDQGFGFGEIEAAGTELVHALLDDYDDETGHYSPVLTAWELSTGERVPFDGDPWHVRDIAVHPDGTLVAGLSVDGTSVVVLDAATLEAVAEFGRTPGS
ncbi:MULTISPECIES: WD40 repeat domain-containing serine/threonine protein kinase [unclassified Nocardiopsis]|uniref:WD40 repeat domain-containing serine/threonine protein kinase n=1 Tax=Nocardiopsis TaxID=2013 RepID=UPI00387B53BA